MAREIVSCTACGKQINRTLGTCSECGARCRTRGYRRKSTAIVLAVFFGSFGAHRFYLRSAWGLVYWLFVVTLIPAVVGIIEGVIYAATSRATWDRKHNEDLPEAPRDRPVVGLVASVAVLVGVVATIWNEYRTVVERQATGRRALLGEWHAVGFRYSTPRIGGYYIPPSCKDMTIEFMPDRLVARSGAYEAVMSYHVSSKGKEFEVRPRHISDNGGNDCRGQSAERARREWARKMQLSVEGATPELTRCTGVLDVCISLEKRETGATLHAGRSNR